MIRSNFVSRGRFVSGKRECQFKIFVPDLFLQIHERRFSVRKNFFLPPMFLSFFRSFLSRCSVSRRGKFRLFSICNLLLLFRLFSCDHHTKRQKALLHVNVFTSTHVCDQIWQKFRHKGKILNVFGKF